MATHISRGEIVEWADRPQLEGTTNARDDENLIFGDPFEGRYFRPTNC